MHKGRDSEKKRGRIQSRDEIAPFFILSLADIFYRSLLLCFFSSSTLFSFAFISSPGLNSQYTAGRSKLGGSGGTTGCSGAEDHHGGSCGGTEHVRGHDGASRRGVLKEGMREEKRERRGRTKKGPTHFYYYYYYFCLGQIWGKV